MQPLAMVPEVVTQQVLYQPVHWKMQLA